MTVLNEIAAVIEGAGLGVVGADLFLGTLPNDPDACCALREYGGAAPEFGFGERGVKIETPAVQVVFRGAPGDYAGPRTKAEAAYRALAEVECEPLSGTFYHWIHPQNPPADVLGRDEAERVRISFNVLAEKEPSA